ncbi:MAG TPA: pyridoxal-phosphate dependent enzyme [bacterium]|nr:pyridoxal-phosphate dependent enzyme [Myxococcales bacterium]OQA60335.1 MAG: Cysteine synthase [bacterium ADurb.Bin270]HPW45291.1 pyridoxal-phosphate dependent enzyme [bacterium]HQG13120.1 pyridoxal-phosphate dependent enzyme [bacterium]HQH80077.1 pyridoxal-phosphate dependent enzyme [bacterium]
MVKELVWGPTYDEMLDPSKIPHAVRSKAIEALEGDPLSPLNLYNISWKDSSNRIRHIVLPKELTGVDAEICVITGRGFPTGSHKVGATYSCTVEKQIAGEIEPGRHRLIWPSTGNFGVGGAYVGERMNYESLVILPEEVSKERFEKIAWYGAKYFKTPGCESNVKEIYDKTHELEQEPNTITVNQFTEFANYRFHYYVTGNTLVELFEELKRRGVGSRFAAITSAMGSAGTIACGDRVKESHPSCRIIGLEPVQCPTLYSNGFGGHDIQGIGGKHVTWIHNTDNTDAMICIDEWDSKKGMQLIHEEVGTELLVSLGADRNVMEEMKDLFGISGICNILGAIKAAKFYGFGKGDILFTIATDSIDRYYSILDQMNKLLGKMDKAEAERRLVSIFHRQGTDYVLEGTKHAHDCWANLKYYTWVEQQGKSEEELRAQRSQEYWKKHLAGIADTNRAIIERRRF